MNKDDDDDFLVIQKVGLPISFYVAHYPEYQSALKNLKEKIKSENINEILFFREFFEQKENGLLFRKSSSEYNPLITFWLSNVRNLAHQYSSSYKIPQFQPISSNFMCELAKKSDDVNFLYSLEGILRSQGVLLIFEPSLPGLKLDGSVFLLDNNVAVLAMSLRFKRIDYFWFTLMHELAHLSLHTENLTVPIIDEDIEGTTETDIEEEANQLAQNCLIPRKDWRSLPVRYNPDRYGENIKLIKDATALGIHPAIIAGRIRKTTGNYSLYNEVVNEIDVREMLLS